jgi:hypothetical protein
MEENKKEIKKEGGDWKREGIEKEDNFKFIEEKRRI